MTAKDEILELMEQLPNDATLEDAIERLIILYKVRQGLEQLDNGEGISHEGAKRRIRQWSQGLDEPAKEKYQ